MKKQWLTAVLAIGAVCLLAGCTPSNGGNSNADSSESSAESGYIERIDLRAQVGYNFDLPTWLTEEYTKFSLTDKDGNALTIENNSVYFDEIGDYSLSCGNGALTIPVYVVDTEKPSLTAIEGTKWDDPTVATFSYGDTLDLDEIFVPIDNSGSATATFTVYEMGGTKVTLGEGNLLTCNLKSVGYYTVETLVKDATGNSKMFTNRIASTRWFDPALGAVQVYQIKEAFSWGLPIEIATSALENGAPVSVTMDVMTEGMSAVNGTYIRAFASDTEKMPTGVMLTQPAGWDREDASDKFVEFTPVKFTTVVRNGKVEIMWGIVGPETAQIVSGQIFYFRNVQVTEIKQETDFEMKLSIPGGTYAWAQDFVLKETDLANNTTVHVSMKVKSWGLTANNGTYLRYYDVNGASQMLTAPAENNNFPAYPRSDELTEYTEIEFETIVKDGAIVLQWSVTGPENPLIDAGQIFYFKDIEVTATGAPGTPDEEDTDVDLKLTIGGEYSWGKSFTLTETDIADGTEVIITLKIKTANMNTGNGTFVYYKTTDGTTKNLVEPAGWDREFASDKLTNWTDLTFTTVVENGAITLTWGITGPDSAWVEPNQTFYFKDIKVTQNLDADLKLTIGGEYSWGKSFALTETNIADGTAVTVTLNIKTDNMQAVNGTYLRYKAVDGSGVNLIEPAGWDRELAADKLTTWTELTFTTIVEDGAIKLTWAIAGPDSAWVEPNQTFYFAEIVVVEA